MLPSVELFVYLAAVVDWFSRRVLAWRVSITMDTGFCIEVLEEGHFCLLKQFHNIDGHHDSSLSSHLLILGHQHVFYRYAVTLANLVSSVKSAGLRTAAQDGAWIALTNHSFTHAAAFI